MVGALSSSDPDVGDTFIYSLVAGTGSTDNSAFNISGNDLRTSAVFDFETKPSYSIRIRTTDLGGLWVEKAFTITVTDANDAPTDITLTPSTVAENSVINTVVGVLSSSDIDVGDTFIYSLVTGTGSTDNSAFNISGSDLRTSAVFDFETKPSYSIRIRSTDQGGLWVEKAFTITVSDVYIVTSLSTANITNTYGQTIFLQADLIPAVAGKTIDFTLNGVEACSATTNSVGHAICNTPLVTEVGDYLTGVSAEFLW